MARIHEYLDRLANGRSQKEMLECFAIGIVSMLYTILHKNGILIQQTFPDRNPLQECTQLASVQQTGEWASHLVTAAIDACSHLSSNESAIVGEIRSFIDRHLLEDFTRDDIASALHFNADYLSRVFKKETGTILSDYILLQRMTKARELLETTQDKIADIARNLGYNHFSHFARTFRNAVGVTPQEYRMKYRKIL